MRHRFAPLALLVMGIAVLIAGVSLTGTQHGRDESRVELRLQRALDAERVLVEGKLDQARTVTLMTASNPAFAHWHDVPRSLWVRQAVQTSLARFGRYTGVTASTVSFVDVSGREEARVSGGVPAAEWQLSADRTAAPYYALGARLAQGEVHITRPYRSADTGERVISVVTPIVSDHRGLLQAEVNLASLRAVALALHQPAAITVFDAHTGVVVFDARDRTTGGLADGPGPEVAAVMRRGAASGALETSRSLVAYARVRASRGDSNDWIVVAAAPDPALVGLGTVFSGSFGLVVLGLVLVAAAGHGIHHERRATRMRIAAAEAARLSAERRSLIDPLTGLTNRRGLAERVRAELARAARGARPPGVLLADLDAFKAINDEHGHGTGDAVLVELGRRLQLAVRGYDEVSRWGGEEFVVLVPEADEEGLVATAERLRDAVRSRPIEIPSGGTVTVTMSVGGAIAGDGTWTVEALTDAADRAMYAAKRRGRDCVRLAWQLAGGDDPFTGAEAERLAEAFALAADGDERTPGQRARRIADLAAAVAIELGLPDRMVLRCRLGGWLADVDQTAPRHRRGGADRAVHGRAVEQHVDAGTRIVTRVPALHDAAQAVRHHHERWDGSGYPDGLAGARIPLEARVVAVADAYCGLADRGDAGTATAELERQSGTRLDPECVRALAAVVARTAPHVDASQGASADERRAGAGPQP